MDKGLRSQILRLLLRSHDGIKVEIRPSEILGIKMHQNTRRPPTALSPTMQQHEQAPTTTKNLECNNTNKYSAGLGVFTTVDSIPKGEVSIWAI